MVPISNGVPPVEELTWREQEVLILLADRHTNREIADRLHLAESTVKDYVGRILSKLYVKNRRQAVEKAKALHLLEVEPDRRSTIQSNLPTETTPFIGRREELKEIKQLYSETRLVTLTGPGGIGKTRLALKVAEESIEDYKDGVWFISLAKITACEHITQTIAEALEFPLATSEDPRYQLLRYIHDKNLLLVLDNFEHLLEGVNIVSDILRNSSGVNILATSRERLSLLSETVYQIRGLDFPPLFDSADTKTYDAVVLFVQSANKVCPGFDPAEKDVEKIVKICQHVQGMPLAIELAAAWMQILTLGEISIELQRGLEILAGDVRDVPDRHRNIYAVFDYSWSMLQPNERDIFKRLSVFRGGFTREAAQYISGSTIAQLKGLVDKSFLSHNLFTRRFEMHELLRQYAIEQLANSPKELLQAQESHAAYYAAFMQERGQQLRNQQQMKALKEIEEDIENVRTAWRLCLAERHVSKLWMFIINLWYLHWIRWWNLAGMELFREAVQVLQEDDDQEALTLCALAKAFQGYFMAWLQLADQGYLLAVEGVKTLKAQNVSEALICASYSLSVNAYFLDHFEAESNEIKNMVDLAERLGDRWLIGFSMFPYSLNSLAQENFTEAERIAQLELEIFQEVGDRILTTLPLIVLGHVALARGDYQLAWDHYLRCLNISEEVRFHYSIQTSCKYLGKVAISLGRIPEAERYLYQSLLIAKDIGFIRDIVNLLYEFARLEVARGNPYQAVELLTFVVQHPASNQSRLMEGRIRDDAEILLVNLEGELPQDNFREAMNIGEDLELEWIFSNLITPNP